MIYRMTDGLRLINSNNSSKIQDVKRKIPTYPPYRGLLHRWESPLPTRYLPACRGLSVLPSVLAKKIKITCAHRIQDNALCASHLSAITDRNFFRRVSLLVDLEPTKSNQWKSILYYIAYIDSTVRSSPSCIFMNTSETTMRQKCRILIQTPEWHRFTRSTCFIDKLDTKRKRKK